MKANKRNHFSLISSALLFSIIPFLISFILPIHKARTVSTSTSQSKPSGELKKSWNSNSTLKKNKKMGLGIGASGIYGLFGMNLELNLTSKTSFQIGFGKAPSYQTFHAQIKKSVNGKWFSPYLVGGYSLWYTNNQDPTNLTKTTPPFLAEKFLRPDDSELGHFAEHIVYASMGLQYFQVKEPWIGLSFYGEFNFLINTDDFIGAPTGGLGVMYYF